MIPGLSDNRNSFEEKDPELDNISKVRFKNKIGVKNKSRCNGTVHVGLYLIITLESNSKNVNKINFLLKKNWMKYFLSIFLLLLAKSFS